MYTCTHVCMYTCIRVNMHTRIHVYIYERSPLRRTHLDRVQVLVIADGVLDRARAAVRERGDEIVPRSAAAQRPQLLPHRAQHLLPARVAAGRDNDVRALLRERDRRRQPQPGGACAGAGAVRQGPGALVTSALHVLAARPDQGAGRQAGGSLMGVHTPSHRSLTVHCPHAPPVMMTTRPVCARMSSSPNRLPDHPAVRLWSQLIVTLQPHFLCPTLGLEVTYPDTGTGSWRVGGEAAAGARPSRPSRQHQGQQQRQPLRDGHAGQCRE